MKITVATGTVERQEGHRGGGHVPCVGRLDQPVPREPVVGRETVGHVGEAVRGVALTEGAGELRQRILAGIERRDAEAGDHRIDAALGRLAYPFGRWIKRAA